MLARDALIWSDRLGLKGETNGGKVANSTVAAADFACKPMVQSKNEAEQTRGGQVRTYRRTYV